jgi:hypothetical protein
LHERVADEDVVDHFTAAADYAAGKTALREH